MRTARLPEEFADQRSAVLTTFRCEKCTFRYPNTPEFLVIQDGIRLCRPNCAFNHSPSEWDSIHANAIKEAAQMDSDYTAAYTTKRAQARDWSLMDGVSALTDISSVIDGTTVSYPQPVPAYRGASIALTGYGVGFKSADTLTFSTPDITVGSLSIASDQLSFTSTIEVELWCVLGDYDLLFNSNIWRRAVQVR